MDDNRLTRDAIFGGICAIIAAFISGGYFHMHYLEKKSDGSAYEEEIENLQKINSQLAKEIEDLQKNSEEEQSIDSTNLPSQSETENMEETTAKVSKVNLAKMDYFFKDGAIEFWNQPKDNVGTVYRYDGISFIYMIFHDNYISYYLGGEYTEFTGVCILGYNYRTTQCEYYFEIYGDDKLLYTTDTLKSEKLPTDFSVDITGVEVLKIKLHYVNMHTNDFVGIANAFLH